MMDYQGLAAQAIAEDGISQAAALALINSPDQDIFPLISAADRVRRHFKENKVRLCAIINAKSGRCSENCFFCGQSGHYRTDVATYPLLSQEELVGAAKAAEEKMSATCFSIVTSGKTVHSDSDLRTISDSVAAISAGTSLNRCVSVGSLNAAQLRQLKKAGLKRVHHNLEAAASYFDRICTTHSFADRLKTIKLAKEAGLEVCSGGIFGLGESNEQRIELAFSLKELDVISVPINILNPIPGTPAAAQPQPISAFDVLRLVAAYRFILPSKDIGIFGGRERALGELQPLMFPAGANVTLIGDYLTTKGQAPDKDLKMIAALGLEIGRN